MRTEIRRICTETKITTVYVTHDQKEALSMADAMAVLRAGRVVQLGPPRQLYQQPKSRFVADFLGETNFLTASVVGTEDGAALLDTPIGQLRSAAIGPDTPKAGNVTCSIRPEAIRVGRADSPSVPNSVLGRCVATTYLGELAQHRIELAGGQEFIALELNPSEIIKQIDRVRITIDAIDVVILND
jgi:iron(III) transport system ATP-binding protein